jgi:hypothetical protein
MMRRGIIFPEDTINQIPISINGFANSYIKIKEESPILQDSTGVEEFDF